MLFALNSFRSSSVIFAFQRTFLASLRALFRSSLLTVSKAGPHPPQLIPTSPLWGHRCRLQWACQQAGPQALLAREGRRAPAMATIGGSPPPWLVVTNKITCYIILENPSLLASTNASISRQIYFVDPPIVSGETTTASRGGGGGPALVILDNDFNMLCCWLLYRMM